MQRKSQVSPGKLLTTCHLAPGEGATSQRQCVDSISIIWLAAPSCAHEVHVGPWLKWSFFPRMASAARRERSPPSSQEGEECMWPGRGTEEWRSMHFTFRRRLSPDTLLPPAGMLSAANSWCSLRIDQTCSEQTGVLPSPRARTGHLSGQRHLHLTPPSLSLSPQLGEPTLESLFPDQAC